MDISNMRKRERQKWWMVGLALLAAVLLVAQRPNRKFPSPADPGMAFAVIKPVRPEIPDPSGGVTPDDDRDDPVDNPVEDYPVEVPRARLAVDKWDVLQIKEGSEVGKPGEWMLIVDGAGFVEGERSPIVRLGDSMVLDEVFVGKQGNELCAIISADAFSEISSQDFFYMAVQNPGGMNRLRQSWAEQPILKAEMLQKIAAAPEASFRFGTFNLEWKK